MLDEYRGLYAKGDQIMKLTESESIILLLFTFKKSEEYLNFDEMEKALNQVLDYKVSMSYTRATMNRLRLKLEVLGETIKKKPRVGYYIKELKRR